MSAVHVYVSPSLCWLCSSEYFHVSRTSSTLVPWGWRLLLCSHVSLWKPGTFSAWPLSTPPWAENSHTQTRVASMHSHTCFEGKLNKTSLLVFHVWGLRAVTLTAGNHHALIGPPHCAETCARHVWTCPCVRMCLCVCVQVRSYCPLKFTLWGSWIPMRCGSSWSQENPSVTFFFLFFFQAVILWSRYGDLDHQVSWQLQVWLYEWQQLPKRLT